MSGRLNGNHGGSPVPIQQTGLAAPADERLTLLGESKSVGVLSVWIAKAIDLLVCRRLKFRVNEVLVTYRPASAPAHTTREKNPTAIETVPMQPVVNNPNQALFCRIFLASDS